MIGTSALQGFTGIFDPQIYLISCEPSVHGSYVCCSTGTSGAWLRHIVACPAPLMTLGPLLAQEGAAPFLSSQTIMFRSCPERLLWESHDEDRCLLLQFNVDDGERKIARQATDEQDIASERSLYSEGSRRVKTRTEVSHEQVSSKRDGRYRK